MIYTDKRPPLRPGEKEKGLTRAAIRVEPASPRHQLDPLSRLNYAKLYTVEYNVKVWFVGSVNSKSEHHLIADYNDVHPPMGTGGPIPASSQGALAHTGSQYETPTLYNPTAAPFVYNATQENAPGPSSTPYGNFPGGVDLSNIYRIGDPPSVIEEVPEDQERFDEGFYEESQSRNYDTGRREY